MTSLQFRTFVCVTVDDGTRYLREDPSIGCDTTEYSWILLVSGIGIFVYAICVPAMCTVLGDRTIPRDAASYQL